MVTVAIAGGTGKIGLTIAEVLEENPKHKSETKAAPREIPAMAHQKVLQVAETHDANAPVFAVDYTDAAALAHILEANAVHTVISTIQVNTPEAGVSEINLVKAASRSGHAKRFISSDWSIPVSDARLHLPQNAPRTATIDELCTTDLEWTTVYNGQIVDYFGTPHIKSHMGVFSIHIDTADRAAAIPGTGNDVMSFTYSFDVARFVEAALDMPRWEKQMFCYGDTSTYNDVLRLAEKETGSKFTVTCDSVEKLEKGEMTELPSHALAYPYVPKPVLQAKFALFGLYCINGLFHLLEERSLNKVFPQIKTKTVEEVISAWKGK